MKAQIEAVAQWMGNFGQGVPSAPSIPIGKVRALRHRLIVEESRETRAAETLEDALDGIADQLVIVFGTAAAYGFNGDQITEAFKEVMASNARKFWRADQIGARQPGHSADFAFVSGRDAMFIVRDEGGKVIKPPGWVPPDFSRILATTKE